MKDNRPFVTDGAPSALILERHPAARLRLIRFRVGLGMTRPQLADQIGLPRDAVFRIETGTRTPTLAQAIRWLDALGRGATIDLWRPQGNEPKMQITRRAPRRVQIANATRRKARAAKAAASALAEAAAEAARAAAEAEAAAADAAVLAERAEQAVGAA